MTRREWVTQGAVRVDEGVWGLTKGDHRQAAGARTTGGRAQRHEG